MPARQARVRRARPRHVAFRQTAESIPWRTRSCGRRAQVILHVTIFHSKSLLHRGGLPGDGRDRRHQPVRSMPVDLFPPINLPEVVVATFYSGMPPEDIETDITNPLERFFTLAPASIIWSRVPCWA